MSTTLRDLYQHLSEDFWRREHPFSSDLQLVNDILHDPFARDPERAEALGCWLQRHQPCMFGRLAAKRDGIHYCFLTDADIFSSDDDVRNKIADSRRLWKQRGLRGVPKPGFLLAVCSAKVARANPDPQLQQFARYLQMLAGWPTRPDVRGTEIVEEWLYLRTPDGKIFRFVFSVDFFASAGDGRWWHDHRVPGGLAFTANSLGHMLRVREWYEGQKAQSEWALRTAMLTIDAAARDVPYGPATWLLEQIAERPFKEFSWTEATPLPDSQKLRGKDCGCYAGFLHTDHAVRPEFFQAYEAPPTKEQPWAMDFTYIFDREHPDHFPFMGHMVEETEVIRELGPSTEWRAISALSAEAAEPTDRVPDLEKRLQLCRLWRLTDDEEAALTR